MQRIVAFFWLVFVLQVSAQVILAPAPSSCAASKTYTNTFSSAGVLTLDIKSTVSTLDDFMLVPSVGDGTIQLDTTVYCDSQAAVDALQTSQSTSFTTLSVTLAAPGVSTGATVDSGANSVSKSLLLIFSGIFAVIAVTKLRPSMWMVVCVVVLCAGAAWAAGCGVRAVTKVAVPATVHTVCFNGQCFCNCAVRGSGVNIHFTHTSNNIVNTLGNTGFGSVRMDFAWGAIEQTKGVYDYGRSGFDWLTANLTQNFDITPYYILDYGNAVYTPGGNAPILEDAIIAFGNYAVNATSHFKGKNIIWELWNEPNGGFWKNASGAQVPNVTQYAALGLVAGAAVKAKNPSEVFVGPATAGFDTAFLQSCFDAGMLQYWDAVSVHFYRGTSPDTATDDFSTLRRMIRIRKPADRVHIGILSGEWGYTTANNPSDPRMVTEDQQAQYITRQYMSNLAHDVPVSIWYDFVDDGTDSDNSEHRFGVFRNQYYANRSQAYDYKPSGLAASVFFSLVRNLRFNKLVPISSAPAVKVALFNDGGDTNKIVIAFWSTTNGTTSFQLPVSSGTAFTLYNMYGNITSNLKPTTSYLNLAASESPQYLQLNEPNEIISVLAAIPRLPIDTSACIANANISVRVPNPTGRALSVTIGNLPEISVAPGQTAFAGVPIANPNTQFSIPTTVLVHIADLVDLTLTTNLVCDTGISVAPSLATGSTVTFFLSNPSGSPFSGNLNLGSTSHPVSLAKGQTSTNVTFPLPAGANATVSVNLTYTLTDTSNNIWVQETLTAQLAVDVSKFPTGAFPSSLGFSQGGDSKVPYNATVTVQTMQGIPCFKLEYIFYQGWKYLQISPGNRGNMPSLKSIGMWVYGDNSRNFLRSVFTDSTGQSLQYTFGAISWVGWQYVSLDISTQNPGFWGGANDGKPHYPLKWSEFILLDSTQQGNSGTIYVSSPTVTL